MISDGYGTVSRLLACAQMHIYKCIVSAKGVQMIADPEHTSDYFLH